MRHYVAMKWFCMTDYVMFILNGALAFLGVTSR